MQNKYITLYTAFLPYLFSVFYFAVNKTNTDILNTVDIPEVKSVWICSPGIKMVGIGEWVENYIKKKINGHSQTK